MPPTMTNLSSPLQATIATTVSLIQQSRWEEARALLAPLRQHSSSVTPQILHLWGVVQQEMGDLKGAMEAFSQALIIRPMEPAFHLALGVLLKKKGMRIPAMERLQEALQLNPNEPEAHFHLGDIFMDQGKVDEAIHHLAQATQLKPDFVEAWINLGLCQKSKKQLPEALICFQNAIQAEPDNATAHVNLAMTHLIMGSYDHGWAEYEWRFQLKSSTILTSPPDLPRWHGEPLTGKTILILGEQGFGDMVQFIRFAAGLKQKSGRVLLTAPTSMVTLFQTVTGVDLVQDHIRFAEPIDYFIPLLSLPALLGITMENIPFADGYLTPDPKLAKSWLSTLSVPGFKVGLIWEGKPLHQNDPLRRRSCTLADLAPLAQVPGVVFFTLQKGEPGQQALTPPANMQLIALGEQLNSFSTTAAVMSHLDLIITIDTVTAHLAGALGKPVWTLLPTAPDWRWGITQDTTPWYTTMRLFRQVIPNHWAEPILQMTTTLETIAMNDVSPLLSIPTLLAQALTCYQQKDYIQVNDLVRQILNQDPENADAFYLLGVSASAMNRNDLAENLLSKAIAINPNQPFYHFNQGSILGLLGRTQEAKQSLLTAIALKPDLAEAHINLGNLLFNEGEHRSAAGYYITAVRLNPSLTTGYYNLGVIFQEYGDHLLAMDQFQQALRCEPESAKVHMGCAASLLKTGRFLEGWQEYEWRFQLPNHTARICPVPRWDGSSPFGQRIYVYTEQGYGDAIMFARYAPLIRKKGGIVHLECRPELVELFTNSHLADLVYARKLGDEQPPPFDYDRHIPLLSLPNLFGTTLETIPNRRTPYLTPTPERVQAWAQRLGSRSGLRVGLVWSGNPNASVNRNRACTLEDLLPLTLVPNITFYSLQKGPPAAQLTDLLMQRHEIISLDEELTDFSETAAALMNLDLLISTDTAIVHLAGAIGTPVWTLLHSACEWRWLESREDSPWYPTMRLFRQQKPEEWFDVINEVRGFLAEIVEKEME
ncbi:MAG: tetratricopeptide repeat protein [Magnetococcales bacterium]|nr:tetratricopeptide repeat protein [Magnetococcales bacterium]